jgi:hypothetical protein
VTGQPTLRRRSLLAAAIALPSLHAARANELAAADLHRLPTGDLGTLVAIDLRLGGTPWRCLIDSGASSAVVSPRIAREQRLDVIDRRRVATAGGVMQLERVALPPVEVGALRLAADSALVLDLGAQLGDAGVGLDGLIGAPSLRERITRFDLAAGRVSWLARAEQGGAVWPLRWDQGLPVVKLALGDREGAPFLFDTGNAGALVVFARHAVGLAGTQALPRTTMQELGGAVSVHQALLDRLAAPGYTTRDVPVVFEAGSQARRGAHFDRLAGSAGLALFAAGAVTLDGPGERLIVEQPGLPEPAPLPGGFGFALGAGTVVNAVFDGGPAARAGVRPGQRLRRLDEREVTTTTQAWQALQGRESARFDFDGLDAPVALARERFFARWR